MVSRHSETSPSTNLYASRQIRCIRVPARCLTCFAPGGLESSCRNSCAISVPSSLAAYQLYHCLQSIFCRTTYLFIFRFSKIIPFADLEPCYLSALSPFAIDHLSYLYLFIFRLCKAIPFADLVVQLLVLISHFRDFFVQLLGKIFASKLLGRLGSRTSLAGLVVDMLH